MQMYQAFKAAPPRLRQFYKVGNSVASLRHQCVSACTDDASCAITCLLPDDSQPLLIAPLHTWKHADNRRQKLSLPTNAC